MSSQRPSDISCQARERLLQLCQELRLQVNCRKSSLTPSQDMTYLDMQIQSVWFIANPTATWVGNLLKIIEEFLSSGVVFLGDSTTRGRRSFSPSARLELLLGRVRRQLGRPRRGNPSVRVLVSKPKRGFSINLRGMMAVQGGFLEFSSLLRGRKIAPFCDCITTVAYLRRSGATRSHTPGGGPGPPLPVASDHSPIRYAAVSKAPCVLCYSVAFLQPWGYPRTYAFPPITLITSVLLRLRTSPTCDLTLIAPLLASRGWSPALLDLPPDTPIELP